MSAWLRAYDTTMIKKNSCIHVRCEVVRPKLLSSARTRFFPSGCIVSSGVDIEQVELGHKSVTREDCVPRFLQIGFRGTAARRYMAATAIGFPGVAVSRFVHVQPWWRRDLSITPQSGKQRGTHSGRTCRSVF